MANVEMWVVCEGEELFGICLGDWENGMWIGMERRMERRLMEILSCNIGWKGKRWGTNGGMEAV